MNRALCVIVAFVLVACGSTVSSTPAPAATPRPAAFHLANVTASFINECARPLVVDELFCEQVHIGGMTAEGDVLTVPTTLDATARERALVICGQIARAHFNGVGADLGFASVGILDRDGGHVATCSVS